MKATQQSFLDCKQAPKTSAAVINVDETFIKQFVDRKMAEGKASSLLGWTMAGILADVQTHYGIPYVAVARQYIIHDVCGIMHGTRD